MTEQTSTETGQEPTAQQRADQLAARLAGDTGTQDQSGQGSGSTSQQQGTGQGPSNETGSQERRPDDSDREQDSWLSSLPQRAQDEIRRLRGESASHRTRLRTAEQERDTLRQAQETEAQRIERERDEAIRQRDELRLENLRHRVIQAKGLPADAAQFLSGSTEEELAQNADRLMAMIGNGGQERRPDFDAGARSSAGDANSDMSSLIRRAAGRPA